MHYHFNYPYYPAAWQEADQGIIPNGCVTQGTNGTKYGYDSSVPIGANTPDTIKATGQLIYANYWLADGTFIMQFGDLGNESIPDVEFIFTVIDGTLLQYVWQSDTLLYEASNLTLATQLITDYVEDEDVCYTSLPLLQKFISYDMNITDVEGTNTLINNTSYAPHFNAPVINATQNGPGSILVDGTTDISTGFKPSIPTYSIEETITGELQNFGSDTVINGDFANGDAGWILSGDWVVEDEELKLPTGGSSVNAVQNNALEKNKTFLATLDVLTITTTVSVGYHNGSGYVLTDIDTIGRHEIQVDVGATTFNDNDALYIRAIQPCSIDNVSLQEILVPTQRTEARLLTHTDGHLGANLFTNGDFGTGDLTGWVSNNPAQVTVSGGQCTIVGTAPFVNVGQNVCEQGKKYRMTFDVISVTGDCAVSDNDANYYAIITSTGENDIYFTFLSSQDAISFICDNTGTVTIDNVVIREVSTETKYYINGIDQSLSTYGADLFEGYGSFDNVSDFDEFIETGYGWSYDVSSDYVVRVDTAAFESHFYRGVNLVDGATYELRCDSNFASGSAQFWTASGTTGHDIDTPYTFVSDTTFLNIGITTTDGDFSFDNLTIREVVPSTQSVSLPDPDTVINLNDTAIIGYNDIIESREAPFNVHSEIITP